MKSIPFVLLLVISSLLVTAKPLRLGIAGFTHDHVHQILGRPDKGDVEIVGVAEPNRDLAMRYLKRYKLSEKLWSIAPLIFPISAEEDRILPNFI